MAKLCETLSITRSSYYAWENRPQSARDIANESLKIKIKKIHDRTRQTCGSRKITRELRRGGELVNHKRVERLMRQLGLKSRVAKKYKATTNSNHHLPVADNILNRQFISEKPNLKMVSDITYLWTEEGWLYIAGVMDLYGQKIVGLSMGDRMTKELVINALDSACKRYRPAPGALIHSDRGSQYCSNDYQNYLKRRGFICSMSRKGNCWDNAPMEAFWGKMKYEWLHGRRFLTRDQARAAVFEYVEIFYNRRRLHETNGYLTPDEYYHAALAA